MDIKEVMLILSQRFTSGNNVPVERSNLKADEYEVIRQFVNEHSGETL